MIVQEEMKRRKRVFAIIIASVMALIACLALDIAFQLLTLGHPYKGIPLAFVALLLLATTSLWEANRRGYTRCATLAFLGGFYLAILYATTLFGTSLPMGLLGYALLITMTIATLGARAGILAAVACVLGIWIVGLLEHGAGIIPLWKQQVIKVSDLGVYSAMLAVGAFFAWFSNRELERSLVRAYASEGALRRERDRLEETVESRTRAWKEAELGRSVELARLAEFGKLSAGMVHDLLNPLTAVSLSMQALEHDAAASMPDAAKQQVETAIRAAKRMESHISLTRKHLKPQRSCGPFDLRDELRDVVGVLSHSARKRRVRITLDAPIALPLVGDALAAYQAYANIVLNSIEAFDGVDHNRERILNIFAKADGAGYRVVVEDNGCGMSGEALHKAFDPFFTTKPMGIGLGLSVTKDALAELSGRIEYSERAGGGTVCSTFLPMSTLAIQ